MKLFLIGAISLALAHAYDTDELKIADHAYDDDWERSTEGVGHILDFSGLDLVLSTALNQAVSSTVVPVVGLAGGFTRSAVAFVGSLSALKPAAMLPTSFYNTVNEVILSFANPATGQITSPVSMDEFLDRLRIALANQSVVDFESFKRVCDNLKKIVLLYPFVTTGAYLTYLSHVLGTLQAVLAATHPVEPTARPATIPLEPATHALPILPSHIIPSVRVDPVNLNVPNMGWTGTLDGGWLGHLGHTLENLKTREILNPMTFPRVDTIINPSGIIFGLDHFKNPAVTGINALGALNSIKASAANNLLAPIVREPQHGAVLTPGESPWVFTPVPEPVAQPIIPTIQQAASTKTVVNGGNLPWVTKITGSVASGNPITAAKQAVGNMFASHLDPQAFFSHPWIFSHLDHPTSHPTHFPHEHPTVGISAGTNAAVAAPLETVGSTIVTEPVVHVNNRQPVIDQVIVHPLQRSHPAPLPHLAHPHIAQATTQTAIPVAVPGGTAHIPTAHVHPLLTSHIHPANATAKLNHAILGALNHQNAANTISRAQNLINALATEDSETSESEEFIWSLPDASVYFLQRLDMLRPSNMSPASFLQVVNKTIQDAKRSEEINNITPSSFVEQVAKDLDGYELNDTEINSISRRVEGSLNGAFPSLTDILSHITSVISEKLAA